MQQHFKSAYIIHYIIHEIFEKWPILVSKHFRLYNISELTKLTHLKVLVTNEASSMQLLEVGVAV